MNEHQEIQYLKTLGVVPVTAPSAYGIKFLKICERLNLSPYTHEVYVIKKWDPDLGDIYIVCIGINGLRKKVHDTKEYTGCDEPIIDGNSIHEFKLNYPVSCTFSVYRNGSKFTSSVLFNEYAPKKLSGIWKDKPCVMLSKVAEANALRKAFPELNGLYIEEELDMYDIKQINNSKQDKINIGVDYILNKINKK